MTLRNATIRFAFVVGLALAVGCGIPNGKNKNSAESMKKALDAATAYCTCVGESTAPSRAEGKTCDTEKSSFYAAMKGVNQDGDKEAERIFNLGNDCVAQMNALTNPAP